MARSQLRHLPARVRRRTPVLARRALVVVLGIALSGVVAGDHRFEPVDGFHTRPGLSPPELTVDVTSATPAAASDSSRIFVAPWRGDHQAGPMILDARGEMVWFRPMPAGEAAMDFRVQRYEGERVLTWWEGEFNEAGYGLGEYVIADQSYRVIERFRTGGDRPGDFHEYLLTPRGTALVTIYRPVPRDLSAVGGPENGTLLESIVQEVDVETGRVLLDWRASDHVDLAESHESVPTEPGEAFDFFHINSIDVDDDGDLLLSARHTDAVYKIDRRTGAVQWRLGGTRSDFAMGPGARFFSQHDARRRPDGTITLFDNSAPPERREASRAIALRLDPASMTANLEEVARHPLGLLSDSQGNAQALPGDGVFVGWGSQPYFSQFDDRGRLRFDAHFPDGTNVYRAYRAPWQGRPSSRPAVAVEPDIGDGMTVYASWNGATEVDSWSVLAGPSPDALRPVASSAWEGFESVITVPTEQEYVAVRAMGPGGALARSRAVLTNE